MGNPGRLATRSEGAQHEHDIVAGPRLDFVGLLVHPLPGEGVRLHARRQVRNASSGFRRPPLTAAPVSRRSAPGPRSKGCLRGRRTRRRRPSLRPRTPSSRPAAVPTRRPVHWDRKRSVLSSGGVGGRAFHQLPTPAVLGDHDGRAGHRRQVRRVEHDPGELSRPRSRSRRLFGVLLPGHDGGLDRGPRPARPAVSCNSGSGTVCALGCRDASNSIRLNASDPVRTAGPFGGSDCVRNRRSRELTRTSSPLPRASAHSGGGTKRCASPCRS